MFVCAGESEQFDFAQAIGIGMVDTSINLTKLCVTNKPEEIVFVGTAGSYGNIEIFDIVESAISVNIENSFLEKKSYTPVSLEIDMAKYYASSNVSRETRQADSNSLESVGLKPESLYASKEGTDGGWNIQVNSSNYITTDSYLSSLYLSKGIDLENMEFFAVMKVAEHFGIPARGIFAVTNYCDNSAHDDFTKNHAKAMEKLSRYVESRYA